MNAALDGPGERPGAGAAEGGDQARLRLLRRLRDGELSLAEVLRRLHAEDAGAGGGNDGSDHS